MFFDYGLDRFGYAPHLRCEICMTELGYDLVCFSQVRGEFVVCWYAELIDRAVIGGRNALRTRPVPSLTRLPMPMLRSISRVDVVSRWRCMGIGSLFRLRATWLCPAWHWQR